MPTKTIFEIKPENCKFIIKETERKVICIFNDTQSMFINYAEQYCPIGCYCDYQAIATKTLSDKLIMPKQFVGIATCSPTDQWDEKIGRTIAFSRLKDKIIASFFRRANTYFNTLDKWLDLFANQVNGLGIRLEDDTKKRHEYIEKYLPTKE